MNVVIIEDEELAAEDLVQTLVEVVPSIHILACLHSVEEALTYFQDAPHVDLIFSDIQLGDGISFEIFNSISLRIPIVFCTAYDAYLLPAFKTNGIDYIMKPISTQSIAATMEKYFNLQKALRKEVETPEISSSFYQDLLAQVHPKASAVLVHQQDRIIPVEIVDIALCYIELENVFIKTFKGKDFLVMKTLDELEKQLGGDFYRANRQHLLARQIVQHASYTLARKLVIDLHISYASKIYVSREKAKNFLRWLAHSKTSD